MARVPNRSGTDVSAQMGHGEFVTGEFTAGTNVFGRQAFVDAVVEIKPTLVSDLERWTQKLASEATPLAIPQDELAMQQWLMERWVRGDPAPITESERARQYISAVTRWVNGDSLSISIDENDELFDEILDSLRLDRIADDWIVAAVLYTLYQWANAILAGQSWPRAIFVTPVKDDMGFWHSPRSVSISDRDEAWSEFRLSLRRFYNLRLSTAAGIKRDLMEWAEQEIDRQLDEAKKACQDAGLKPTPKKKNDPSLHFHWLARFQVLGEGYSDIGKSEEPCVDRRSVDQAIKKTAALIGLTLRSSDPRGRPVGR